MEVTESAIRVLLVVVLGTAALAKRPRRRFRQFVDSLVGLRLGRHLPTVLATWVLASEVGISVALLVQPTVSTYAVACLFFCALGTGLAVALVLRRPLRCNCFGPAGGEVRWSHVVRDGVLAVLSAVALWFAARNSEPGSFSPASMTAGLVASIAIMRWDDLAYLLTPRSASAARDAFSERVV